MTVTTAGAKQEKDPNGTAMLSKRSAGTTVSDKTFVKKAAEGGLAEVELVQLAAQKATSDDVKKFGQRMVDDHSKANDELKSIAGNKNITTPQDVDAKHKALMDRLSKLSGPAFDRASMSEMVKDAQKDVNDFTN